jgi:NAD(P)-dependent dehydrogenase (short-subunit alcohol dehydrogenase family)
LDKLGFKVYAGCLKPEAAEAQELKETTSNSCSILHVDVTDKETIAAAKKQIQNTLGSKSKFY